MTSRFVNLLIFVLFCSSSVAQTTFLKRTIFYGGAQYKHEMDKTQIYPQIGFEYKISELSAFEFQIGYHNEKPVKDRFHFIPVSIGYKFNFVPLVTSNQKVCSQINLYSSAHYVFRYDYAPSANYSKIAHDLIFSSGIDLYLTSHWGLTVEKNFGITSNYYNMWRGGAKYRF